MEIIKNGEDVVLIGVRDFDLKHIFECGQCFRWDKIEEGRYIGVAKGKLLDISQKNNEILFRNTSISDFHNLWFEYFDFGRDYQNLKETLSKLHPIINEAVEFGHGIRILNQEHWETLISFIISANNNIPRIKKIIDKISMKYGSCIGEVEGTKYYSFPNPEEMKNATVEDLKEVGLGYRAKYIHEVIIEMIQGERELKELGTLDTESLKTELLKFSGVGPKVASCIMLFSYGKQDVFPVDTWIRKVMSEWFKINADNKVELSDYIENNFAGLEGVVQQYLFYYARENKLGG